MIRVSVLTVATIFQNALLTGVISLLCGVRPGVRYPAMFFSSLALLIARCKTID